MILRPRKLEIDRVSEILDSEAMLEDMARAVLMEAWQSLLRRELWLVVTVYEDGLWCHGPFFTRNQAVKTITSTEIAPKPGTTGRVFIRRLISSSTEGSEDDSEG